MQNEEWKSLFRDDADNAIRSFMDSYGVSLERYISGQLDDPRDAEECYFDTLYELSRNVGHCEKGFVYAYAVGIARRQVFHKIGKRSGYFQELEENISDQWEGESRLWLNLLHREVKELLGKEKQRDREIFLYHLQGYRVKEIAQKMDLTKGQVQMTVIRVRHRIADELCANRYPRRSPVHRIRNINDESFR